jgi:hemoglobin/transferrin/lactoferrin receptor protein
VGGGGERSSYDTQSIFAFYAPTEGPLSGFRVDIGVDNVFDEAYSRTFTNANEPGRNSKARVSYKLAF